MRKGTVLCLSVLLLALWGCGAAARKATPEAATISISPDTAVAGASELTLTIRGTNFTGPDVCSSCRHSVAVWSVNSSHTPLATTFVSSTKLTATVPANLLTSPVSASVWVEVFVGEEEAPGSNRESAAFAVTTVPLGPATISALSPESAMAGSSDVTLTITGANFENFKSQVGWSTDPTDPQCCNTWLDTTFVSSTELKAVVPAALLQNPGAAQVFVETGDPMGMTDGVAYPRSNPVAFTVTP